MKAKTSRQYGKRPVLPPEERDLFLEAMSGVQPLGERDRLLVPPPPPAPVQVAELPPEVKLAAEADGARYAARAPGVSHAQVAALRAGKVHTEATLDLHGATVAVALEQLRRFLVDARRRGQRCVRIIHGRCLHSEPGVAGAERAAGAMHAPLREAVLAELLGPLSGLVHAFSSAAPADGGDGATNLLLRGRS